MYRIAYAQSARKALKRLMKSGSFPKAKFKELLGLLMNGKPLPASSKDHKLQGKLLESRECHLGFDLLVIYKRNEIERIVLIEEVGTHPELFGE